VDIAWVLLVAALSGAALVLWLSMQSTSPPAGAVYIVRVSATSIAVRGGAPSGQSAAGAVTTPVQRDVLPTTQPSPQPDLSYLTVYVTGAVSAPGVYTLPAGSRLYAAIAAAGGPAPDADLETVNMAQRVQDEDRIVLGHRTPAEQPAEAAVTPATVVRHTEPTAYPTTPTLPSGVVLNINTATAQELEALPGIGTVLAARIVKDREANGPFKSVDDLKRVNGIGEGIVGKVREHVTAGP